MINYDMHIHTEYCGHAPGMTVQAIIEKADKLGLDTIAITDHIFGPENLAVLDKIKAEAAKIKSRCRVIIGAEIDVDGRFSDGRLVTDDLDGIDYIVGGLHYIPGVGNYPKNPLDNPFSPEELICRWWSTLLGLVGNPKINTLAHPGRMIASAVEPDVFFDDICAVFAEAAEISARNKINWEINELNGSKIPAGLKQKWHRIYKIALIARVKLIYGSDAHSIDEIGQTAFTEVILSNLPKNSLLLPPFQGRIIQAKSPILPMIPDDEK